MDTQRHPGSAALHDQYVMVALIISMQMCNIDLIDLLFIYIFRVCDQGVWHKFTHDNLLLAEREEGSSQALRHMIEQVLQDTTEDLRAQCATVDRAFTQRCMELNQAKTQLELQLAQATHHTQNLSHYIQLREPFFNHLFNLFHSKLMTFFCTTQKNLIYQCL